MAFSPKQIDFLIEPLHDFNVLSGVTGSGKSFAANLKWYETIVSAPKNSIFIQSGNTEDSLYDNITKSLLEDIDFSVNALDYRAIANKRRIIVKATNTQVLCVGASTENAQNRIQGKSVRGWYADEVVKQPKSFVDMANSRCRQEKDGKIVWYPRMWTCNPDHSQHFIKKDFIDNQEIDVKNWYFGFWDNPLMTQEFIDGLGMSVSGVFKERMFYGKWVAAEGAIFTGFSRDEFVVNEFPKGRIVEYCIGIDWGWEHPMAIVLMGITGDNQYYVIDEIHESHLLVDKALVSMIQDRWGAYNISQVFCDPSRPEYIYQLDNHFGHKLQIVGAANDVIEGIQELQKLMVKRGNGEYGIYFMDNAVNCINNCEGYRWKPNSPKDEPIKIDDDAVDAIRYVVYSKRSGYDLPKSDMKIEPKVEPIKMAREVSFGRSGGRA